MMRFHGGALLATMAIAMATRVEGAMLVAADAPATGAIGSAEQANIDKAKGDGRSTESSSPAEEKSKKERAKEYSTKYQQKQEQFGKAELKARADHTTKYWGEEKAAKTAAYAKQKAEFEAVKERTAKVPTNQDPTVVNPWALPEEMPTGRTQSANLSPSSLTTDSGGKTENKLATKPAAKPARL